ncbi:hypothetical protein EV143_1183 [Flavobacterium chryseum]|uniref:hypothetical protein n=1 Tax=Flavobacterium sp. P3160 TaxID=2512113 RepID=UPI00105E8846|nr:hypothetical protein [Flavobacterium sp. P3160]TDO68819.1 hypothetical protein EV143_1183 [Flavobacterium sp. P3160]
MINFILFIVAYLLYLPLSLWNFCLVGDKKGYFRSSAITIDKLANREFRTLWNKLLKVESGYKFGSENETISSVLGKNQRDGTLSKAGNKLASFLDWLDKEHCKNSIEN